MGRAAPALSEARASPFRASLEHSGAPHRVRVEIDAPRRLPALLLVLTALAIAVAVFFPNRTFAAPRFPPLTGRVVDEAGILSPSDKAALVSELAEIEKASTDQLVVVTLDSLQGYPIEDFGYQLGRHWGIGQKDKNNGILLIVAPKERKVRIEVGYGLEPVMTDALSKLIIENAILPQFRKGDYPAGIRAGVRDIKDVLLGDAEAVKQRALAPRHATDPLQIILFIFWLCIVLYVMWAVYRSALQSQKSGIRRGAYIPGSSGGWSGGGWSGGGGGGGGWSGGGGGFGGGGSSGSW